MIKIKILIVEDDEDTLYIISDFLQECNFDVRYCSNATNAISYLNTEKFDILLLDLNLPDFNGFDILTNIKNKIAIPTMVISAYSTIETKLKAFKLGAIDYMTKPIELEELEARILTHFSSKENITLNKVEFTLNQDHILFKDMPLKLTKTEFEILSILIKYKNTLLKREDLCNYISNISSHRSLDNHITNIRKKIEENPKKPKYLKTEYGIGYKLTF